MTAALPPTDLNAARDEITRLRAELAKYVSHEPTIREEWAHIRQENAQLESQLELARSIAVSLEQENARLTATVETLTADRPVWVGLGTAAAHVAAESVRATAAGGAQ